MARVALKDWKEQIRDPKIECMSRDEMTALQSDRLVKQVKNVYENVEFYRKKMDEIGVEPGDIKGIEDIGKLPFTTKEDLRANYPFGLLAVPKDCQGSGNIGNNWKTYPCFLYTERHRCMERVCGQRSYDGRTYSRRPHSYLLWIWIVHRRHGAGFRSKKAWSNGYPDVNR